MKVEVVKLNRKYNLGNYETLDVCYEAALTELEGADSQNVLNITKNLEKLADQYFTTGRFQKDAKPEQPVKQEPTVLDQFPPEYRSQLNLKDSKIYCRFVSKEVWAEINGVAHNLGYEYIGGKGAHWKLKK